MLVSCGQSSQPLGGRQKCPKISELADFSQDRGFWPNSKSDYAIFRALRDLIFLSTHTHIHPKQDGRKRTNQNFQLVLQGASKVPRDIGIGRFLSKSRFLAKFNIILHNIQCSERPGFLSTHPHFHLAPQGGVKSAPRYRNSAGNPGFCHK